MRLALPRSGFVLVTTRDDSNLQIFKYKVTKIKFFIPFYLCGIAEQQALSVLPVKHRAVLSLEYKHYDKQREKAQWPGINFSNYHYE